MTIPFGKMHQLLNPKSGGRVAPAPQGAAASAPPAQFAGQQDLLGLTASMPAPVGHPSAIAAVPTSAADDLAAAFGSVAVTES